MKNFMKRLVFVLAVTLSVVGLKQSVFAENLITVDETTFPDKELREAVLDAWDDVKPCDDEEDYDDEEDTESNNEDEESNQIDADLIKSIGVYGYGDSEVVTNLKGIELLTKLESLSITNYSGGKFDLSKNTNLNSVNISSNKYTLSPNDFVCLPKLASLDMGGKVVSTIEPSKLKNLKSLWILCKQGVKKVDVSKSSKLESLTLCCSNLTSVNLGKSSKLTWVYIEGAKKLTSVNVSKLTNLTYLTVRDCNISKIDVSKNKKLLTLKINGNKKIKSVNLKNNPNISSINIGYTGITKLDTSKMKKLESLEVYNTKLSGLNLKKNTKLHSIDVSNSSIKKLDITSNKKATRVNIAGSKIKSLNLKNQKDLYGLTYSYGQKITYPSKINRDYSWIDIEGVKKGSSIAVPAFCKGYKFSADKEYSLKYKNNKIITSKKTKKKYAYGNFTKGDKTISISIKYK